MSVEEKKEVLDELRQNPEPPKRSKGQTVIAVIVINLIIWISVGALVWLPISLALLYGGSELFFLLYYLITVPVAFMLIGAIRRMIATY